MKTGHAVFKIAWQIHDAQGELVAHEDYLIQPDGFTIPFDSEQVHGISTALAADQGVPLEDVLAKFNAALSTVEFVVGHNVSFDRNIMGAEFLRMGKSDVLEGKPIIDTCTEETATLCQLPGGRGGSLSCPPSPNYIIFYSASDSMKPTMQLPTWKRLHGHFWNCCVEMPFTPRHCPIKLSLPKGLPREQVLFPGWFRSSQP